jgi:outer membrane lipoprotein-sorting protein
MTALAAGLVMLTAASAQDAGDPEAATASPDAPAPEQPQSVPQAERGPILDEIDAYLADLDVLTGSFYQIESSGLISEGQFWIDRRVNIGAGRMRFEYADPHPYTLISDGADYAVWDRELEDVNTRVALSETPLHLFLKRDVDLANDADIVDLTETPSELALTLKDRDERVEGMLTLVFARPALELRSFSTTDGAGAATSIVLTDTVRGGSVDPSLFVIREPRRRDR